MPNQTPDQPQPQAPDALGGAVLTRALLLGGLVAGGAAALVVSSGALPEGGAGFVAGGAIAAVASAALALLLHGRFLGRRAAASLMGDSRLVAGRLQALLAAAFGIKLFVLAAGVLWLHGNDVKFPQIAAFAVAFAAASLLCQVTAAAQLARALARGVAARGAIPVRPGVPGGAP